MGKSLHLRPPTETFVFSSTHMTAYEDVGLPLHPLTTIITDVTSRTLFVYVTFQERTPPSLPLGVGPRGRTPSVLSVDGD
jgi:hypothetical protein